MIIWKDVIGYEGIYQVNNFGSIRSIDRIDSANRKRIGVILLPSIYNGYLGINLCKNSVATYKRIHIIVAENFMGVNNGMEVNHINGVKTDNRVENLEYCTRLHNMHHSLTCNLKKTNLWNLCSNEIIDIIKDCYDTKNLKCVSEKRSISVNSLRSLIKRESEISKKIPLQDFERGYNFVKAEKCNYRKSDVIKEKKEKEIKTILSLKEEGFKIREIAYKINRSMSFVCVALRVEKNKQMVNSN